MARDSLSAKRSRRFTNPKTAESFAKDMGVEVIDLRDKPSAKSKFKVTYTKGDAQNYHKNKYKKKI